MRGLDSVSNKCDDAPETEGQLPRLCVFRRLGAFEPRPFIATLPAPLPFQIALKRNLNPP